MRVLALFASTFASGIFLAQFALSPDHLLPGAALLFLLAVCSLRLKEPLRRSVLLIFVGASLALGYHWLFARQVRQPMEALQDTDQTVTMTLQDYAVPTAYGAKVTVSLAGLPGKAIYYGDKSLLELSPGQTAEGAVHLQSAEQIQGEKGTVFTSRGVFLLAYARGNAVYGAGSAASARWWPARAGRAMQERIGVLFQGDDAGVLTAMLTGEKSALSQETSTDLSQSGIYHILSVSGMHCAFLIGAVRLLVGKHRRRLAAACALPLLGFYALLTGANPSVIRACVMMLFLLAAPLLNRESDGPTSLSVALALILLKNPFAAGSVGLQLSFAAVAGILFVSPRLERLLCGEKKHGRLFRFTASGISITLGALIWTTPLTTLYFGNVVLLSPLTNLLCLWAAAVIFLGGLLAVSVSFFALPLGAALAFVPKAALWYLLHVTDFLAGLPHHAIYQTNPYVGPWLAFCYLLFGAALLLRSGGRRKYALAAVLAAVTLVCSLNLGVQRTRTGNMQIWMLDVGQGESVLLSSGGTTALIDCGSSNGWYDPGQIAADQLLGMGCKKLDYLLLTHYDTDHVNGTAALLNRLPVETLLAPQPEAASPLVDELLREARERGTAVRFVEETEQLSLGVCTLTVYPPVGAAGDNERGLSVLASAGEWELLVTGDMNATTERALLEQYDLPDIEALAVGHHGSQNATSQELLDALEPELALISVGANSYGHPTSETLYRLTQAKSVIYRTDLQGTIHLIVN